MPEETSPDHSSGDNTWPPVVNAFVSRVWPAYLQGGSDLWAYLEGEATNIPDGTPTCNNYAASCCVLLLLAWEAFALAWYEVSNASTERKFEMMTKVKDIKGWPIKLERTNELILFRDSLIHAHLVTTNLDPE